MVSSFDTCPRVISDDLRSDAWLRLAVAFYMIATTVSFASTTLASRAFIEPIRALAILTAAGIIGVALMRGQRITAPSLFAVLLYVIFVLYAFTLGKAYGEGAHAEDQFARDAGLTVLGIYLVSTAQTEILPPRAVMVFLAVAVAVFVATVLVGGFSPSYPPHFVFEYGAVEAGVPVFYSQGVSKFYGLAAVSTVFLAFSARNRAARAAALFLCLIFVGLSLLGGARGDSIAAALVVFCYTIIKAPKVALFWVGAGIAAFAILSRTALLDDFVIFDRFLGLAGDVGTREMLLSQAATLLVEQPACLLRGCGLGYFQSYYDYDSAMYPHNLLLEATIVWGLPVMLVLATLAACGLAIYVKKLRQASDAFLLVYSYFFLLAMKSGSLMGAWLAVAGGFYFAGLGFETLVRALSLHANKGAQQDRGRFGLVRARGTARRRRMTS